MNSRSRARGGSRSVLCAVAVVAVLVVGSLGVSTGGATPAQGTSQLETYRDIPVGFTADGHPFQGNPDAPVTLIEYSDYLCPFCARHFHQSVPTLVEKYVRSGKVKYVMRDFPIAQLHPTAPRGAVAAACVAEQSAARFWPMYERLFQAQQEWNRLTDPTAFLAKLAQEVGVDKVSYDACVASGRQDAKVQQSVAAATAQGFSGTPTFQFVHGSSAKTYTLVGSQPVDVFARWIDDLLAGKEPPREQQADPAKEAQKPELPAWAKPEGFAPDPKRPGFTKAGDPYKGNPDAKLVLFEFGDFQCPSCQRHAVTTQPELDKRFVATGQVLWIFKHLPLAIHRQAPVAGAAANCAGDQGKFWSMHHALFERMEQWSTANDPDAALAGIAADVGLDKTRFGACLGGRRALERVLLDMNEGRAIGIRNVPAFLVLRDDGPVVISGARPTEQFVALMQGLLDRMAAAVPKADARRPGER
jgi:protein-disulfide isomerase